MTSEPEQVSDGFIYLTQLSPKDKPWDRHKSNASKLKIQLTSAGYPAYADRIAECANRLAFKLECNESTKEESWKLKSARFCRVRFCPICQWRKSLMWKARFYSSIPLIYRDFPEARYILVTLTQKTCKLSYIRKQIELMNKAVHRLIKLKRFPGIGFIKSIEVKKSTNGMAHPHIHMLIMVKPSYFSTKEYITHSEWVDLWQQCLRIAYKPNVDVRAAYTDSDTPLSPEGDSSPPGGDIIGGIKEVFKYITKFEDLVDPGNPDDLEFLSACVSQLHKVRSVSLGGVFKQRMSEAEPDNLISETEDLEFKEGDFWLPFDWLETARKYAHKLQN